MASTSTDDLVSPTGPGTQGDVMPTARALQSDDVRVVDYRPSVFQAIADTWRSRHILRPLTFFFLRRQLRGVKLGPTWFFVNSFMSTAGYAIIFGGGVFSVKAPGGIPYFFYLLVGMMGWRLFMTTVNIATRSFSRVRRLNKELHLPLLLIPIAGSAQPLVEFVLYFGMYFSGLIYYWQASGVLYLQTDPRRLLITLAGLLLSVGLGWGIAYWTSVLFTLARDTRYVLRYIFPFWMYLTPVLYPRDRLHGIFRLLEDLNPMSAPIEMIKVGLLGVGSVAMLPAAISITINLCVVLSGIWFLNRFGHILLGTRPEDDELDDEV